MRTYRFNNKKKHQDFKDNSRPNILIMQFETEKKRRNLFVCCLSCFNSCVICIPSKVRMNLFIWINIYEKPLSPANLSKLQAKPKRKRIGSKVKFTSSKNITKFPYNIPLRIAELAKPRKYAKPQPATGLTKYGISKKAMEPSRLVYREIRLFYFKFLFSLSNTQNIHLFQHVIAVMEVSFHSEAERFLKKVQVFDREIS